MTTGETPHYKIIIKETPQQEAFLEEFFQEEKHVFNDFNINLEFFAVRNSSGQYFHNVGYGGYGKSWVDDLSKAKIYTKIGQARSRVTWFSRNHPEYPMPVIIKIIANRAVVLDETERVKKAILSKQRTEIRREEESAKQSIKYAEEDLKRAQEKLEKLKNKK